MDMNKAKYLGAGLAAVALTATATIASAPAQAATFHIHHPKVDCLIYTSPTIPTPTTTTLASKPLRCRVGTLVVTVTHGGRFAV